MVQVRSRSGRTSDLIAEADDRVDWSGPRRRLAELIPGVRICFACPSVMDVKTFRACLWTLGNRLHAASDWKLATRTRGRTVHCFLTPRS